MRKSDYFEKLKKELLEDPVPNKAALAIREAVNILTSDKVDICTLEEFLLLVDLDYKDDWNVIAEEIARKLVREIRFRNVDPKKVKPWHSCEVNYKTGFSEIAHMRTWSSVHSALNKISEKLPREFERTAQVRDDQISGNMSCQVSEE